MKFDSDICIWLFSRADMASVGDAVLVALSEDRELAPQRLGLFEPFTIDLQSSAAHGLWQTEAKKPVGLLGGERKRPVRIGLTVSFGIAPKKPFHTMYWSADVRILKLEQSVERIESLFRRLVIAFRDY